ncbi:MAG: hypothetical protein RSB37_07190 [Acetivibrio sp.]
MKKRIKGFGITAVVLAMFLFLFCAVQNIEEGQGRESQKQLEKSIQRGIMTCYATEGIYPPTLQYLKEEYGIIIEEEYYSVFYEVFADNIMPNVTVVPLK